MSSGRKRRADDLRRLGAWSRSQLVQLGNQPTLRLILTSALLAAALLSGLATYATLAGSFGLPRNETAVVLLLLLDLVLLLLLATLVAWHLVALWLERRRGLVGARLHLRLVLWFGLVALLPTIFISTLSVLFFVYGMDKLFGDRVSVAVKDSLAVAQAYVQETKRSLFNSTGTLVLILRQQKSDDLSPFGSYERFLTVQSSALQIDIAKVVDAQNNVLVSAKLHVDETFVPDIPEGALDLARRQGEPVILPMRSGDRLRAIARLSAEDDTFLYTERMVDPKIVAHADRAMGAALVYSQLEGQQLNIRTFIALIFVVIALLLLFAAVWAALTFSTRLIQPITRLVGAADRIGAGDLGTRVPEGDSGDEIGTLSRAFNRMTQQIEYQRNELISTNHQLEERRRFMEVVLAGVSAGVIGLDEHGCINLPNRSASDLLATDLMARIGEPVAAVVPEMASLVEAARQRPSWLAESQISLVRGAETRTLLVRVVAEFMASRLIGFVVTFDDVTELLSAQRKAAWADVARRIAHEIKNPLTPIQLSAERLKRKYLKEITSDPDTFQTCTDTIVRQVGDIGRMVDEFSAFARMPAPVMAAENMVELCRQAIFLQHAAYPSITFSTDFPSRGVRLVCDAQQIGQALTNLLKNAAEAIEARIAAGGPTEPEGHVLVVLRESAEYIVLSIEDNGRGLPDQGRERLTEPYVTTRQRGTGLGLAIVKKIVEDHGALLQLDDRPGGGAIVRVTFRHSRVDSDWVETPGPELAPAHGG
jgi:two-component system nitrogen regulation sensor histidine kinase NtrY